MAAVAHLRYLSGYACGVWEGQHEWGNCSNIIWWYRRSEPSD